MMDFIYQEAKEKADEIEAKVVINFFNIVAFVLMYTIVSYTC